MSARLAVLLLLGVSTLVAAEPQENVMLHVYSKDGVFHYAPSQIEVLPNATVVLGHIFGNHSITSVDGLFNETGNASLWPSIRSPASLGTYRFYCWIQATPETSPENGMAGDLVVAPPPVAEPSDSTGPTGGVRQSAAPPMILAIAALILAMAQGRR